MSFQNMLLKNPINRDSINSLFKIVKSSQSENILIDIGAHEFEDISSQKELKQRFEIEDLSHIKKIAFLHPREFQNISQDPERYQFFTDKQKAIHWLEE
jgi:CHASE2 domain-containing sensor protein